MPWYTRHKERSTTITLFIETIKCNWNCVDSISTSRLDTVGSVDLTVSRYICQ